MKRVKERKKKEKKKGKRKLEAQSQRQKRQKDEQSSKSEGEGGIAGWMLLASCCITASILMDRPAHVLFLPLAKKLDFTSFESQFKTEETDRQIARGIRAFPFQSMHIFHREL